MKKKGKGRISRNKRNKENKRLNDTVTWGILKELFCGTAYL